MQDFARFEAKRVSRFRLSPLQSFKKQQKQRGWFFVVRKVFVILFCCLASLTLSITLISWRLLASASWKRDEAIGVVVHVSPVGQILKETQIVWFDPLARQVTLLNLPGSLPVRTKSPGNYTLSSLFGLSSLEQNDLWAYLQVLVRNTRIGIASLIFKEGVAAPNPETLKKFFVLSLLNGKTTWSATFSDRFAYIWFLVFTNPLIKELKLPQSILTSDAGLDDIAYDAFVAKNFPLVAVAKENLSLAVVNVSGVSKLASTVGRIFSVLGVNVLWVGDSPNLETKTTLMVKNQEVLNSKTVSLILRYLQVTPQILPEITKEYRADIVLFMGKADASSFTP